MTAEELAEARRLTEDEWMCLCGCFAGGPHIDCARHAMRLLLAHVAKLEAERDEARRERDELSSYARQTPTLNMQRQLAVAVKALEQAADYNEQWWFVPIARVALAEIRDCKQCSGTGLARSLAIPEGSSSPSFYRCPCTEPR